MIVITLILVSNLFSIIKKEKKNDQHNQNCVHNQKSQKFSILATEVNVAKFGELNSKKKKNKNQTCLDKTAYDLSQIKCYNYQNLGYYGSTYLKLSKN